MTSKVNAWERIYVIQLTSHCFHVSGVTSLRKMIGVDLLSVLQ